MKKITVIGSLNMDFVCNVEDFPLPGETKTVLDFKLSPGGKGANQAATASKLGGNVDIIGKVGEDEYGDVLLNELKKIGVDISRVKKEGVTGRAFINVNSKGENIITYVPGANMELSGKEIRELADHFTKSSYILLQQEVQEEVIEVVVEEVAKSSNCKVILNAAPAKEISMAVFRQVDTLIVNEGELEYISGKKIASNEDMYASIQYLINSGIKEIIVTIGERGAIIANLNEYKHIPAYKVSPVDTTGAGDTFVGAYAVALSEGLSTIQAVEFATKASAMTVTKKGALESIPVREEIFNFEGEKLINW
ncbi:ribokinase [Sutcliffiella cohnii]